MRGPFTFDFTVPVEPSRVSTPREVVEAGGKKLVLERVVVSPTATRIYLRGVGPNIEAELSVDGWSSTHPANSPIGLTQDQGGRNGGSSGLKRTVPARHPTASWRTSALLR